jgi:hypothetical protein
MSIGLPHWMVHPLDDATAFHIVCLGVLGVILGVLLGIYRVLERIEHKLPQAKPPERPGD